MRWWEIVGVEEPSDDTPSVTPVGRASSLREGAGNGCGGLYHSTGYSLNRKGAGDFHRPYEGSECFTFYRSIGDCLKVGAKKCTSSL